ncbi:28S ribosomal protein S7 [Dirofilaria immitis]
MLLFYCFLVAIPLPCITQVTISNENNSSIQAEMNKQLDQNEYNQTCAKKNGSSAIYVNKVTVFAGPSAKTIERTIIRTDNLSEDLDENADAIGRMASAIAHIFLSDKTIPSVNVSINLQENSNDSQTTIK